MVTQMSLGEADFQQLQAQEGVAVTFCLKEFRVRAFSLPTPALQPCPSLTPSCTPSPSQGLLSFAESANLPLSIHFDSPGR